MRVRGRATIVTAPEGGSHMAFVGVHADDAAKAVAAAWVEYGRREPGPAVAVERLADHDGWTDIHRLRYQLPPNDRFATVLPFSVAIGRVGCVLAGCCRGTPFDGAWAVVDADGVARHPAPVYEMLFSLAVGAVFVVLLRKGLLRGRLFAVYLITYGSFRFLVEIVRDTPDVAWGLSGYQLLALSMLPLGLFGLLRRLPPLPEAEPLPTTPALEAP